MSKYRYFIVFLPREAIQTFRQLDNLGHHSAESDAHGRFPYSRSATLHRQKGSRCGGAKTRY